MTTTSHFVAVSALPAGLRAVLSSVGYGRADIELRSATEANLSSCGGQGERAFAAVVPDATTPERTSVTYGSWGGPNPFSRGNPVDDLTAEPAEVPECGAIVTGYSGHKRTSARIAVRPELFATLAPVPAAMTVEAEVMADAIEDGNADAIAALAAQGIPVVPRVIPPSPPSELELHVLDVFRSIKGGARQKYLDEIADGGPSWRRKHEPAGKAAVGAAVDRMVAGGYLKRAKNGATTLTTAGKNAIAKGSK